MISSSREQRELESLHNEALVLVSKRDSQQTLRKIELLLEKATRLNATKYLGAAYGIKGYVYFGLNETKLAIDNFEKSFVNFLIIKWSNPKLDRISCRSSMVFKSLISTALCNTIRG